MVTTADSLAVLDVLDVAVLEPCEEIGATIDEVTVDEAWELAEEDLLVPNFLSILLSLSIISLSLSCCGLRFDSPAVVAGLLVEFVADAA